MDDRIGDTLVLVGGTSGRYLDTRRPAPLMEEQTDTKVRWTSSGRWPMVKTRAAPIPFAGSQLGDVRHVCAFFSSADEEYRVLLPFIRDGFARGDKAVHVVKPDEREDHLRRLVAAGIDTDAAERSGQFELRNNTETYLRDGRFDQDRMLAAFEQMASGNARGKYPISRIVCHMDWAADDRSHLDTLVEFEARVNDLWSRHDDVVICVYDLSQFGGDMVIDMMRTHPMIIVGGIL